MNIDKRGGNRPRRPRISKSNYSGKNTGPGPETRNGGTNFNDENRHNSSKRGNWNDSGSNFRTESTREKGLSDTHASRADKNNEGARSSRSGNTSGMNIRGGRRFSKPERQDIFKPKRTLNSETPGRNNASGVSRRYDAGSGSSKFSDRGKKTINPQRRGSGAFQNKRVSDRAGTRRQGSYGGRTFSDKGEIRLNRFIAHSGICSRRQADDFIKAGLVSINDQVVTEMGTKVKPDDVVKYNGESIRSERKVYILLNKPKNYVTSLDDEESRKTVMELISDACPERVYPVGRLDRNTTGVMLLTNDGELTGKLTHPRYNKKKIYHVFLDKNLKKEDLNSIAEGVNLEDGPIAPDSIAYVDSAKKSEIGIEIHSGRNRIVRRMFEYFGYKVIRLDRVYFAGLTKKNLPRGKWRFLTEKEIYTLKMNSYE